MKSLRIVIVVVLFNYSTLGAFTWNIIKIYVICIDRVTMSQHLEERSKDNRRITERDIEQPEPIVKQDLLWRSKWQTGKVKERHQQ
jgi:hypothetical protein